MEREDNKNMMPEEEYLKRMSSLPKVKAPEDFLKKVHERIERRSAFEKIMRTLLIPAMAAAIILIVSTVGIKKPVELSLLVRAQAPAVAGAMQKSAVFDSLRVAELKEKSDKEEVRRDEKNIPASKMSYTADPFSRVKSQIESVRGKVTKVEMNKETGAPEYVDAEIPAAGYAKFIEKLSGIGTLHGPALKGSPQARGTVRVRIKLQ